MGERTKTCEEIIKKFDKDIELIEKESKEKWMVKEVIDGFNNREMTAENEWLDKIDR